MREVCTIKVVGIVKERSAGHCRYNLTLCGKEIHRRALVNRKVIRDNESMERPKTYTATIEVTFDAWEDENPRAIARNIADSFDGMRGANLYADGVLRKLVEEKEKRNE